MIENNGKSRKCQKPEILRRSGFGHRMENGLVKVAQDKIVSTYRQTNGQTNMKIAYA